MQFADRVKQAATATSDAVYVLGAAETGYQTFFAGLNIPNSVAAFVQQDYPNVPILVETSDAWQIITATVRRAAGSDTVSIVSGVVRASSTGAALGLTTAAPCTLSLVPTKHAFNGLATDTLTFATALEESQNRPRCDSTAILAAGLSAKAMARGAVALGEDARASLRFGAVVGGKKGYTNYEGELGTGANDSPYPGAASTAEAFGGVAMGFMRTVTADATPTPLAYYFDGAAGPEMAPGSDVRYINAGFVALRGILTAIDLAVGDRKAWDVLILAETPIDYSTTTVHVQTFTELFESAGATGWSAAVAADGSANEIAINVTGEAATNIVWEFSYTAHSHGFDV